MVDHAGPYTDGLGDDYPIALATFHDREVARSLQQLLSRSGIFSKLVNRGTGAIVFVDNDDHDHAVQLFNEHREQFPNRIPVKNSRRFDFLIFGLAIGLTLGGIFVPSYFFSQMRESMVILISFTAIGAAMGHLLDRQRMSLYRRERIRVGVWEVLIMMSIIGMTIMVYRHVIAIFEV